MSKTKNAVPALLQVQTALRKFRDGELPDGFNWEDFKYAVVDPALGNDGTIEEGGAQPDDYDPNYLGIMDNGACSLEDTGPRAS